MALCISTEKEFVCLATYCPGIKVTADYATMENFTGQVVPGYLARKAFLTRHAADALRVVQAKASDMGLALNVFDGYRPSKAVDFFWDWAQRPEERLDLKEIYYPHFSRLELFEKGYLIRRSSHSRGSTVDLTLCNKRSGLNLDMGTSFDYFDITARSDSEGITAEQLRNRSLLRTLMEAEGFKNYVEEWWHYTLKEEPFPDEYFDHDIF